MNDDDKLQVIEDMGINWKEDCPSNHGLKDRHLKKHGCEGCWIKALEEPL
jgi:hypothetical protein